MHLILADEVTGGLLAAAAFLGGLLAAVLALGALVPAWQRNRRLTLALVMPAFLVVLLVTLGVGYGYVTDGLRDPDYSASDFVLPWVMFAGPALASGLLVVGVLALRMRLGAARVEGTEQEGWKSA